MKIPHLVLASVVAISVQIPLSYFFISLESLVLGLGFIGAPNGLGFYLFYVIVAAFLVVSIVGLPGYLLLEQRSLASTKNVSLAGFLLPVFIFCSLNLVFSVGEGFSSGEKYYGTYRKIIVAGERTLWGWVKFLENTITYGVHGLIGAILFHKVFLSIREKRNA